MKQNKLTLGSLFDGSGGFPLGGILAGIEPKWSSEIEPFCIRVTTKRLPQIKHLGDISQINGAELEPVDIITWGSPCQGLSQAGMRKGLADERSGLYVEAVRIVKEMLEATNREYPKYCVFENVPGLLSSTGGKDFLACMDMMQSLGFIPDVNLLDSQNMGVPQRRKRVYITWLNVDYILKKRTNISDSITLQLLTELLLLNLGVLSKASANVQKKLKFQDVSCFVDGLMRRIELFSLQKEERLQMLQSNLNEIQATCLNAHISSDLYLGEDPMEDIRTDMDTVSEVLKTVNQSWNIGQLLKNVLDESLNLMKLSTISTLTKETMIQKIFTCFQAVRSTLLVTIHLTQSLEKVPMYLNCYEWVSYTLTEIRGYINAQQNNLKGIGKLEWNDLLRFYKQEFSRIQDLAQRYITDRCEQEILPITEGLSGYFAESFRAWQAATRSTENCSGTSGTGLVFTNHGQDTRFKGPVDVAETISASYGTGGNNQPFVVESAGFCTEHSAKARGIGFEKETSPTLRAGVVPATLKIRCGHGNGGRGALVQEDKSATLSCNNDQTLFVPKAYGICSKHSNSMMSDNPNSGFYEADTARTIDTSNQSPCKNQGGVVVLEGNGSRPSHHGDGYKESDTMYCLNCTENHAVSYGIGRPAMNQAFNANFSFQIEEEKSPTIVASGAGGVSHPKYSTSKNSHHTVAEKEKANTLVASDYKNPPMVNDSTPEIEYIVRRLTPQECALLQGMPPWWCDGLETENPTYEEIDWWYDVFETHRKAIGKSTKPKSRKLVEKWLKNPYSDSAAYKMYGNGIALPCAWFVLAGIAYFANLGANCEQTDTKSDN